MANLPDAILEMPAVPQLDIEVRKGADCQFRFRATVDGVAVDPTGWTVRAQLRSMVTGGKLADFIGDVVSVSGVVWMRCRLPAAVTATLAYPGNGRPADKKPIIGRYDVQVTDAGGAVAMIRWGVVRLVDQDTV